jgi:tRNA-modifying protein YgfZ
MVIDLSERTKLQITGADRLRYLNGQLTNDLRGLAPGHAIYACALTPKGKLAADLYVAPEADSYFIDAASSLRESLMARLERYVIADDVSIADVTDQYKLFHFMEEEPPPSAQGIRSKNNRFRTLGTDLLFAVNSTDLDSNSFSSVEPDRIERLRIERGVPRWGAELSEEVIPAEAGLDETAISFTKGCYLGQEVISRIKSLGHVNRHLRGLKWLEGGSLEVGCPLFTADNREKAIGLITSVLHGAPDPSIALGYVRRGFDQSKTVLKFGQPGHSNLIGSVEVTTLPFQSV